MNASAQLKGRKFQIIPVKQLIVAPDNPRQTPATKAQDEELKNSIRSVGVVMPLIVKPTSKKNQFGVYAGGRRLTQTKALIQEKDFPADHKLHCVVVDKNTSATEISMIETMMRAEMHPIDQYEAFAKLNDPKGDNLSIAEIALHFGRTEHAIRKILALGSAHPELRKKCRAGELTVEVLQAYCITDDKKRQLEAYKSLEKDGSYYRNHKNPDAIRKLLTTDTYTDRDKIVKAIGVQAYRDRGGEITTDLFQGQSILHDTKLVQQMFQEHLDAETARLQGEGWSWVEANLEYSEYNNPYSHQKPTSAETKEHTKQLKEIAARRKKIELERKKLPDPYDDEDLSEEKSAEIEQQWQSLQEAEEGLDAEEAAVKASAQSYSDKQRANGGCILTLDQNGKLRAIQGLIKREDQPKKPAKKKATASSGSKSEEPEASTLSQAVKDDLRNWHLAAAKTELLYAPGIMYNLMQFSICWELFACGDDFGIESPEHLADNRGKPLSIQLRSTFAESSLTDIEPSRMTQELIEYRTKLNLSWIKRNIGESWQAFLELGAEDVTKLVAYCATLTLQSKVFGRERDEDEGPAMIDLVLHQINARLAKHWRPTGENFFGRVPRVITEAAGKVIDGNADFPKNHPSLKTRKQLVEFIGNRLVGEGKPANNDCWMPDGFLYHTLGEEQMP